MGPTNNVSGHTLRQDQLKYPLRAQVKGVRVQHYSPIGGQTLGRNLYNELGDDIKRPIWR